MEKELLTRIKGLQNEARKTGLQAYIVSDKDSLLYFTGMSYKPEERVFMMIIPVHGVPTFLVPKLEESHLKKITIECEVISYWEATSRDGENWYDVLNEIIKQYERIGVESSIPVNVLKKINCKEIVPMDLVDDLRKVKSPYEIDMIRKTAKRTDEGMRKILEHAYIGASVVEIFSLSGGIQRRLIQEKNFDPILSSLTSVVWPSSISAMPHSIPSLEEKLDKGPNVAMTYFRINGYGAECERTFFLGKYTKTDEEHFHHMMEARRKALSYVKPGIKCSEIDAITREYLIQNGYGDHLLHRTGHGIGLSNHEKPFVSVGDDEILKESMIISIEPGIYIKGTGGYRHSDTILVTKNGFEVLTKVETDLNALTLKKKNILPRIKGRMIRTLLKI